MSTAEKSFFASRWVDAPGHAREVEGLPAGFRAAGVAAGVKAGGERDVGLLVSDEPATVASARFTRSGTQSPPVLVCRERCDLDDKGHLGRPVHDPEPRFRSPSAYPRGKPPGPAATAGRRSGARQRLTDAVERPGRWHRKRPILLQTGD